MKFRRRNSVTAEQWVPGKAIKADDVALTEARIHYSRDKELYYISKGGFRADQWLSVEKRPGPVSEADRGIAQGMFSPGWVEFNVRDRTDDQVVHEETYHRKSLIFAFWKVHSGVVEEISLQHELFLDYMVAMEWPKAAAEPSRIAYLHHDIHDTLHEGRSEVIEPGDWIITEANGARWVCKAKDFEATFIAEEE